MNGTELLIIGILIIVLGFIVAVIGGTDIPSNAAPNGKISGLTSNQKADQTTVKLILVEERLRNQCLEYASGAGPAEYRKSLANGYATNASYVSRHESTLETEWGRALLKEKRIQQALRTGE